jgi:hypothetical protein
VEEEGVWVGCAICNSYHFHSIEGVGCLQSRLLVLRDPSYRDICQYLPFLETILLHCHYLHNEGQFTSHTIVSIALVKYVPACEVSYLQ